MKLTPEQQQMDKDYRRLLKVIDGATKGQYWIKPSANGYTDAQHAAYAKYQGIIDRANAKITALKELV